MAQIRQTRASAVSKGAALGVLAAAFIVTFAVAWVSASGDRSPGPGTLSAASLPNLLLFRQPGTPFASSLVWPGMLYVAGATLVGCLAGHFAWRRRGTVRRRVAFLLALSPLGPWLLAAAVLVVPPLSDLRLRDLGDGKALGYAVSMSVMSLVFSLPYLLLLSPLVAPPVIVGHLLLEGWTRPPELPQGGFARPAVRTATLQVLLCLTAALATFALLRGGG